jgi:dihydrofolate synthase / folylpolyglutamate synthase
MNFNQAYNYLLSLQSLPRKEYMKDPKHCSVYLKRLQFFLDILGNPEKKIPHYIHVTGTSGKGSTVAFLHSILNEAGYKVGSTQSPHPTTITERWQVGNKYMSKSEFVELIEFIKPKLDEYIKTSPYDMLSFFEICEAIGFLYFKKKKVKWAILEVGLGGRYDASNIIPYKDVAIITNIGLDHTNILGNDKKVIAYEKAGIIKKGCMVFTGERNKKILDVIEKECNKNDASMRVYKHVSSKYGLLSAHQQKNAGLASEVAKHLNISDLEIQKGIKKTKLPLRMEVISKNPTIILDGAHNPDKMKTTVDSTRDLKPKNLNLVVAFSADKNINKMIKQLATLKPKSIACTQYTNNPFRQPANPKDLSDKFKKLLPKTKIGIFLDPQYAFNWSKKQAIKNDLLLVTGSMFLAGELRR